MGGFRTLRTIVMATCCVAAAWTNRIGSRTQSLCSSTASGVGVVRATQRWGTDNVPIEAPTPGTYFSDVNLGSNNAGPQSLNATFGSSACWMAHASWASKSMTARSARSD